MIIPSIDSRGKLSASLLLLLLFIAAVPVFAKNPPKTTGPTPTWDRRGKEESDRNAGVFNGFALPISPSLYPFLSGAMLPPSALVAHQSGALGIATQSILPQSATRQRSASPASGVRIPLFLGALNVPSFISPWYDTDASNGATNESEPSLVALTNINGTFTAEAYQQDDGHFQLFNIHVATSTNPAGSFTVSTPYIPFNPPPTGFTDAFDPMLTTNPYGDGIRPGALYLTTCAATRTYGFNIPGNPMGIRVWGSDNGGQTWTTSGQTIAYTTSSDTYILDKPVSDVSWYPATRGYLYVAWVRLPNPDFGSHSILLRRNTNGLWERCRPAGGGCITAWNDPITINDGRFNDQAHDPQVVVNPDNGNVYVFWYSANNNEIRMARSTDQGVSFQPDYTSAPITVIRGVYPVAANNGGYLQNSLRANVVPMIRYNTAAHVMMAAWHARTQPDTGNGNETALYFATFNPDTIDSAHALGPLQPLIDPPGTQMQPAIDNDDAGNVLMTYYTTENHLDPSDPRYQIYGMALSSTGQVLPGCGPTALDGTNSYANGFTGDYHDNYYFTFPSALGALWNTAWSRNTGTTASTAFDVWSLGVK
jgi:hypothetical protein